MQYLTKVIIDGVEVLSNTDGTASPSLASAQLINSACAGAMEIGATASDVLTVTINNPFKASFDGDRVEFYVSPIYDDIETAKERIAAEVGDDETDEGIDDDETEGIDDDETEGDDMTDAEEAETEAYSAELTELQAVFLEGENDGEAEEETDEASDPEWFPLGVYFVNNQNTGDNNVTLTCYDAMALLTDTFILSGTSSTYSGCWNALTTQLEALGIELDPFEFERATDVLAIKGNTTLREALGLLCGYAGGYATCDVDGSIGISYYAYTDSVLIDSELLSFVDTSAGDMLIDGVECHDGRGYTLESGGGGQTIAFTNYLVTQDVLDEVIAPTYRGVRFCGASVSAPWEYGLNAGEFVRIMSEDEYRNYLELRNSEDDTVTEQIALGRIILISTQTITFGGNAITAIGSINPTESEKEKIVMSPTIKRIIEAGKTATNYITEDSTGALVIRRDTDAYNVRIDADSLDIRNNTKILASFGEVAEFFGDYSTSQFDAKGFRIADANERVVFETVNVNSGASIAEENKPIWGDDVGTDTGRYKPWSFSTALTFDTITRVDVLYPIAGVETWVQVQNSQYYAAPYNMRYQVDANGTVTVDGRRYYAQNTPLALRVRVKGTVKNAETRTTLGCPEVPQDVTAYVNEFDVRGSLKASNIKAGTVSTSVGANSYKDYTVDFGVEMASTPYVSLTLSGSVTSTLGNVTGVGLSVVSKTTSGFVFRVYNTTSSTRNWSVNWIAIAS